MNILMLVANPFINDARVYNEATSLIQAGHSVTVIALDREKKHLEKDNWDGINVIRLQIRVLPNSHLYRVLAYPAVTFSWNWQIYHQVLALHKEVPFHVIHCHDFETLPIGVSLKLRLGLPLVYDAHEMYGYMMAGAFPNLIVKAFLWFERLLITMVDNIIVVVEYQKQYFEKITNKPIVLVMNCKPLQSHEYQPPENDGRFTAIYIGGLTEQRFVLQLCHTIAKIPDTSCIIAGGGAPQYVQAVEEMCSTNSNTTYLGIIPINEVIPMTRKADVCVCMFDPRYPNNIIGMPNKLFEAMVCGRPIICTKGTYSGDLTEREETGLTVEYTEYALKRAIIMLRDDPDLRERLGKNALRAAISKYNWRNQETKLLELYRSFETNI